VDDRVKPGHDGLDRQFAVMTVAVMAGFGPGIRDYFLPNDPPRRLGVRALYPTARSSAESRRRAKALVSETGSPWTMQA